MAKITPYLSTRVDARGKSEILLRFVGGRDHIYRLHSHLSVAPSRWKEGAVVIPRLETEEQKELKALRSSLEGLTAHLLDTFEGLHPGDRTKARMQEAVDEYHHPDRPAGLDFFGLFAEFQATKDVSPSRRKRYGVILRSLERFEKFKGKPITLEGVDAQLLQEYRDFLTNEYVIARRKRWRGLYQTGERPPEPRSHNAVVDFLKVVRAFFRWLDRQGITAVDPFKTFEIGAEAYGTPYYISVEERERLYRTNLRRHPALAVQRDIFVFQCLVGCRVGDLTRLRRGDVVDGVLEYIPAKTKKDNPRTVRVPLSPTAREIVERYSDLPGDIQRGDKAVFPCGPPHQAGDGPGSRQPAGGQAPPERGRQLPSGPPDLRREPLPRSEGPGNRGGHVGARGGEQGLRPLQDHRRLDKDRDNQGAGGQKVKVNNLQGRYKLFTFAKC